MATTPQDADQHGNGDPNRHGDAHRDHPLTTTRVITYADDGLQRLSSANESPRQLEQDGYINNSTSLLRWVNLIRPAMLCISCTTTLSTWPVSGSSLAGASCASMARFDPKSYQDGAIRRVR